MSHTVTEKGTVTIPAHIRKKYGLKRGSKVGFVETDQGILFVPVLPLEELRGIDRDRREVIYTIIKELQMERRREASEG